MIKEYPWIDTPIFDEPPRRKRARRFTAQDQRAFLKRVQKRRKRKGYS